MFLLHGRLCGVDGFADAAQLNGEEREKRRGVNLRSCSFASPPTQSSVAGLTIAPTTNMPQVRMQI